MSKLLFAVKAYNSIRLTFGILDPIGRIAEIALEKHEKDKEQEREKRGYYVDEKGHIVLVDKKESKRRIGF